MTFVLGVDPGFAAFGWALAEIRADGVKPHSFGVICTEKSDKKRDVRASDDNTRRAQEIVRKIAPIIQAHSVRAICAECMSFPRSSSVAAKMAMSWGVIATFAELNGIPVMQSSPKEIKKLLCGNGGASKEDVGLALNERFGSHLAQWLIVQKLKKSLYEHAYDALAAVVACENSPVLVLLRRGEL